MDESTFEKFRDIIYTDAGIRLADGKMALVSSRIGKRVRALGLSSSRDYLDYVVADSTNQEIVNLVDAISTNVTSFFREGDHFDLLAERFVKQLEQGKRRFRIWSAGCSSGQEPYSVAMTLLEVMRKTGRHPASMDIRILGTDISTRVLATADIGEYPENKVHSVPNWYLRKYFSYGKDDEGRKVWRVGDSLKKLVLFRRLNISRHPFPLKGPMDYIFCRNTMIYFDNAVRQGLVSEFQRLQDADGLLFVGHSESLTGFDSEYVAVKPSVYRLVSQIADRAVRVCIPQE